MITTRNLLLTGAAALAASWMPLAHADTPDIRIKVKNKSLGTSKKGDTRASQRELIMEIDNRDRNEFKGVTIEWKVIARDINNRKLSIVNSGSKKIDIPANDESEVSSGPYSVSKTEGKVTRINQNRPDKNQFKVDPDTGTRYAGYVVEIIKDGEVIAEAATAGMKKRVAELSTPKKKKK